MVLQVHTVQVYPSVVIQACTYTTCRDAARNEYFSKHSAEVRAGVTAQALQGWFIWQPSNHSPSSLVSCSPLALQNNVATSSKVEGDAGLCKASSRRPCVHQARLELGSTATG